ncbi:MAG TPA: tetratricopeptide repeat protein [Thioploca sp.]|nr:tetratricopeptide repeat protein [Thioploca sp.]
MLMIKTILVLAANPTEIKPLDLKTAVEGIEQALKRPPRDEQFILKQSWVATPDDIRQAMLVHQPHFVHFLGQGSGESGLILADVSTEAVANFFKPFANQVKCVMLNACHTTLQTRAIGQHIDYVISMNQPLSDKVAIQFSVDFYDALAAGESIESAFERGCDAIEMETPQKPLLKKRLAMDKPFWNVPLLPNPFFTGRETVLRQLQETLNLRGVAALSGLSGVGKTQTVAHYAYLHRHEYQAVFWVLADTVESFNSSLVAIAGLLGLSKKDLLKQEYLVTAVTRWLETHSDWLLIVDNADDATIIAPFLEVDFEVCHILLTTHATMTEPFAPLVEINEMPIAEGAQFLQHRAFDKSLEMSDDVMTEQKVAEEITQQLGGLPLALEQAGAYIRETQCGLAGYLERYYTYAVKPLEKLGARATEHDHQAVVMTTWALSFEKIAHENPAAADLLRLCAFLHPDQISDEIFTRGVEDLAEMLAATADPIELNIALSIILQNLGEVLAPVVAEPIELERALRVIFKYSLLHHDSNTKMLKIHRVAQAVLTHGMGNIEQRIWAERAVRAVNSAFPASVLDNESNCERLLPCAQTCAALIDKWDLVFEDAAQLLDKMGCYWHVTDEYAKAKPLYEEALALRVDIFGQEQLEEAQRVKNVVLSDHEDAYATIQLLYQRALAIREKFLGKEHPEVAQRLNSLTVLYSNQGDYDKALPFCERALAIRENVLGKEHPEVAQSLNNLAILYDNQGDYVEAQPLYERALAIDEKAYGKEHPEVAIDLNNLSMLYDNQGDYVKARLLCEQALVIREKCLGKEHPEVAQSYHNLALLYKNQGDYAQAQPLFEQALAIWEPAYGEEHSLMATGLHNLAGLYDNQGDYAGALPLYKRALAIREKVLGKEHPEVAQSLNNLAELYRVQGDYITAQLLCERSLAILEKAYGMEYPCLATSIHNIAGLYGTPDHYAKARRLYEEALTISEKLLGKEHPDVAISLNNLAELYRAEGDYAQAQLLYERSLAILEKVLGKEHPDVATNLNNLAALYEARGDYVQALLLYEQAIKIVEKVFKPTHPTRLAIFANYLGFLKTIENTETII